MRHLDVASGDFLTEQFDQPFQVIQEPLWEAIDPGSVEHPVLMDVDHHALADQIKDKPGVLKSYILQEDASDENTEHP